MITQEQVDALEQLATIDAELKDLRGELETQREAIAATKQQLSEIEEKLARDRASVEEMDRMRSDLTQELRQMSVQIEKSREKLSRCRTEREANAVQRELEELRKLFRDREHEIKKLEELADQARGEILSAQTSWDQLSGELGASAGDAQTRDTRVAGVVDVKSARREELAAAVRKLNGPLYRRYELLRKRFGSAVAVTSDGSCSVCHVRMPPMQFQRLRRGEDFGQCPSCNRIIYFREPLDADVDGSSVDGSPTGP